MVQLLLRGSTTYSQNLVPGILLLNNLHYISKINNNTNRTVDALFVHNNPEADAHALSISLSCHSTQNVRNSFGLLPQGYCGWKTLKS